MSIGGAFNIIGSGPQGLFKAKPGQRFTLEYQAVLDRATALGYTLPSAGQQVKQNQLIVDLKAAGIWAKLDVFYTFATDGSQEFATLNWKAPTLYQSTLVNSPTFTANQGFTGNGVNSYLDTNFNPSTSGVNYQNNNASICVYSNTFVSGDFVTGCTTVGANIIRLSNGSGNQRINMGGSNVLTPLVNFGDNTKKFRQLAKTSSINFASFENTTAVSHTGVGTVIENSNQFILRTASTYSTTQVSFFVMGASLVSENTDLFNTLNNYMVSL